LRGAAVSVPANIAEGFKKQSLADKARFLNIAQGSLEECRYYLVLTCGLNYADTNYADTNQMMIDPDETSWLLYGYHRAITDKKTRETKET
jgi:four helix bundle protein